MFSPPLHLSSLPLGCMVSSLYSMRHHPLLAIVGYAMLLIASIILLVMLVEFDPQGASAKHPDHLLEGTLTQDGKTYALETASGSRIPLLRMDPPRVPVGSPIIAYLVPGENAAIPEFSLPHVPRSTADLLWTIAAVLVCMVLVAGDPRVAYFDIFDHA